MSRFWRVVDTSPAIMIKEQMLSELECFFLALSGGEISSHIHFFAFWDECEDIVWGGAIYSSRDECGRPQGVSMSQQRKGFSPLERFMFEVESCLITSPKVCPLSTVSQLLAEEQG